MSAYLDTGSVLIESACNVERIAAVLYTLAPFVPNFKYYRLVSNADGEVLCCAVLCCAVLYCAVLCCAPLCCAPPRCAVLCPAVLCSAVFCPAVLCCVMMCCALLCCTIINLCNKAQQLGGKTKQQQVSSSTALRRLFTMRRHIKTSLTPQIKIRTSKFEIHMSGSILWTSGAASTWMR